MADRISETTSPTGLTGTAPAEANRSEIGPAGATARTVRFGGVRVSAITSMRIELGRP